MILLEFFVRINNIFLFFSLSRLLLFLKSNVGVGWLDLHVFDAWEMEKLKYLISLLFQRSQTSKLQ